MKIEDSKYILYFFAFCFFGSLASNQDFISFHKIINPCVYEKQQSHINDDSQNQNKDFYRRTHQSNPPIKNNKIFYATPALSDRLFIDYPATIYNSYFEDIAISLDIKSLIYPFNYFF